MTAAPLAAYPGACDCHMHVYEDRCAAGADGDLPAAAGAGRRLSRRPSRDGPRSAPSSSSRPATASTTAAPSRPPPRSAPRRAPSSSLRRTNPRRSWRACTAWRAQRPLHDAAGRRAALVGARPDRGADRSARLARRPAARRPRAAAARGRPARAALPARGRPRRPLPRAHHARKPGVRLALPPARRRPLLGQDLGAVRELRSSDLQPTPTSRRWPGRWPNAIPSGVCGPATGRIRTSCRARPTRRWSTGRSPASPASRRGAGSWSTTRPSFTVSERRRRPASLDDVEAHQHLGRQALADAEEEALVQPRPARIAGLERDLARGSRPPPDRPARRAAAAP